MGQPGIRSTLLLGWVYMLNDAFVQQGGYRVVRHTDGGPLPQLHAHDNKVYRTRAWRWVWSSGISAPSGMPDVIIPSGIYVGSSFIPFDDNLRPDYLRGGVRFKNIDMIGPSGATVDYTLPLINVQPATTSQQQHLMDAVWAGGRPSGTYYYELAGVPLPVVFVGVGQNDMRPWAVGGERVGSYDIYFQVYSPDMFWRDSVADLLVSMSDEIIVFPDISRIEPVNEFGEPTSGWINSFHAAQQYPYHAVWIRSVRCSPETAHEHLHYATILMRAELAPL